MKLYYFPSPNPQKVRFALLELELACEIVPVDLTKGEHRTPEFLALNPSGRVPVLTDGPVTLWESHAILAYLGEKTVRLWPTSAGGRTRCAGFSSWHSTSLPPRPMWCSTGSPSNGSGCPATKPRLVVARSATATRGQEPAPRESVGERGMAGRPVGGQSPPARAKHIHHHRAKDKPGMRGKLRSSRVATVEPVAKAVAAMSRSWVPTLTPLAANSAQRRACTRATTRSKGSTAT
jgi:Glutathione S-transferase, N-terminal domain